MPQETPLQTDAQEILACEDPQSLACETYLFEPEVTEQNLGWLFAAGCTDSRDGVGSELLDVIVTAIQKEYHRDPKRSANTSFEMALHQANLILHDMAEQGMRDWMSNFNVVVASLAGNQLYLSVAGDAQALLIRKTTATDVSIGLSQVPITKPLQTFSQVATGAISPRDTLYLAALPLQPRVPNDELKRIALEHSAQVVGSRLQERYESMGCPEPLAAIIVTALPGYIAQAGVQSGVTPSRAVNQQNLQPRQPLIIQRSAVKRIFSATWRGIGLFGAYIRGKMWPLLKRGSQRSRKAISQASRSTGQNIQTITQEKKLWPPSVDSVKEFWQFLFQKIVLATFSVKRLYGRLPKSSKIFAVLSVILLLLLASSLLLLRQKRASDTEIQQASEALQEARTKTEAAKTALIYDNRDQASGLLGEAETIVSTLVAGELYTDEANALMQEIADQNDRLQRIVRSTSATTVTIGDFSNVIDATPRRIFFTNDHLYTYSPDTNAIFSMALDGAVEVIQDTTQGIGFIVDGTVHSPDKAIVFTTDQPGIALFDSRDGSFSRQNIDFSSSKPVIADINVFGNRLYLADTSASNIYAYNKTLRGYVAGSPWVQSVDFPVNSITSLAIDGTIFTLHKDGSIRQLFKGEPTDFETEAVAPVIGAGAYLLTSDEYSNLYVVDPANKRVVVYDKDGVLLRQIVADFAREFADATIPPSEDKVFILDGTRVLEVSIGE